MSVFLLDLSRKCDCISPMKIKLITFLSLAGLTWLVAGCINTVGGTRAAAIPFTKDSVEARYQRPIDQVYSAAREVLGRNGTIASASNLYGMTNDVRVLSAKVQQGNVWIRVEGVDPHLTDIIVQARTSHGVADLRLAHEIDKEVALELSR
jgi:hypothetical protein